MNEESYDILVRDRARKQREEHINFIMSYVPGLTENYKTYQILQEAGLFEKIVLLQNSTVISAGEESYSYLYIIQSGSCKLIKNCARRNQLSSRVEFTDEVIVLLGTGELIGELPLLGKKQSYTAVVESSSLRAIRIKYSEIRTRYPAIMSMIKQVSD
jgi:CRP-like cAMP-binding protein